MPALPVIPMELRVPASLHNLVCSHPLTHTIPKTAPDLLVHTF
jgi:hypothetical protein